jgi:hypothetical protein
LFYPKTSKGRGFGKKNKCRIMTTGFFGLFETKIDTEGTFSKRQGVGIGIG